MTVDPFNIYLEVGKKKVFASAISWPGWSRSGRDEDSARQSLVDYGPRYARAMQLAGLNFVPPSGPEQMVVLERLEGNMTTDFGAPNIPLPADAAPIPEDELERLQAVLTGCWLALEQAAEAARGKTLRTGPRGGGRDLDRLLNHVIESESSYLRTISGRVKPDPALDPAARIHAIRDAALAVLSTAVRDGLPESGPRGGKFWLPRTYVRRSAWHVLDHAWELEDRVIE